MRLAEAINASSKFTTSTVGEQVVRDYRVLRYRAAGGNDDAQPIREMWPVRFDQACAEDGWTRLENDQTTGLPTCTLANSRPFI